jgi:hypothetical protein
VVAPPLRICERVTLLADLVDSAAPTVVICTLRGSAAGTVDLTGTYCTGGLTPAAKCAAATGTKCNISKVYDQVGTNHWVQTTGTKQPTLTFNAIGGLPAMTFVSTSAQILTTGSAITSQPQPFTFEAVASRTANFATNQDILAATGNDNELKFIARQAPFRLRAPPTLMRLRQTVWPTFCRRQLTRHRQHLMLMAQFKKLEPQAPRITQRAQSHSAAISPAFTWTATSQRAGFTLELIALACRATRN